MTQKNLLQSAGDGTAVPSGYVGEKLSGQSAGLSLSNGAARTPTAAAITLTPGTWLLNGMAQYGTSVTTSFSKINHMFYNITGSSEIGQMVMIDRASSTGDSPRTGIVGTVITVSQNTQIGISVAASWASGTVNVIATIEAVRIA